jgi:DNA-binding transcriptional MerR regulator
MTPKELKKLIKTLRAAGVSYYKEGSIELKLGDEPVKPITQAKAEPVKEITEEEKKEIEHKLEEIKSLMLGSDEDLLDRLFPMPVQEQQESA